MKVCSLGDVLWNGVCLCLVFSITGAHANNKTLNSDGSSSWEIEGVMPEHPAPAESYLCTTVDLPKDGNLKLVGIEPLSDQQLVHHMLLFGCEERSAAQGVWPCEGHGVCPGGGNQQILYGWAKGAPPVRLPKGVGYRVGSGTKIDNRVLQIHFAVERLQQDQSGIKVHLSNAHIPFSAGMMMYASYFEIPPKKEEHLVPTRCCYSGFEPTHGFAFRVHTHMLGRSVYLDEITAGESHRRIVEHSPQLPQGFTPVTGVNFWPGQHLEATCNFNSTERTEPTFAGSTHHNEMCNLYMIMWSELPVFMTCYGGRAEIDRHGAGGLPHPAALLPELESEWKPPPALADREKPPTGPFIGQVAGVAKGHNGSVWVFHRGDRIWDADSFTGSRAEHITYKEPITQDVVLQLDQDTGEVLSSWGGSTFFMPHMITIDRWGFLWLTDVGMHQVFKYHSNGTLLMTLGSRLAPGAGADFCKPTHVAVGNDGSVFVSDGYCNSRVAHFAGNGSHMGDLVLPAGVMDVPHSLVVEECFSSLMVADREAAKVHRFDIDSRKFTGTWDLSQEGLVFGLAIGPYGTLLALCWDRNRNSDGAVRVALLHSDPGHGVEDSWLLPGVDAAHDLAVVAAPMRLAVADRPLAVLVAETRQSGSRLHKFIMMPAEVAELPAGTTDLGSATEQWKAVFRFSTAEKQLEVLPSEAAAPVQAHLDGHAAVSGGSSRGKGGEHLRWMSTGRSTLQYSVSQRKSGTHILLLLLPILLCCGGVGLLYSHLFRQRDQQRS